MPYTPAINIAELKRRGLILDEDEFCRLISAENNYVDPETIKYFYRGFIKVLTQELRTKGVINLPHLGYFALVKQKDRFGWIGRVQGIVKGIYMLKFYPQDSWRRYFRVKGKTGFEAALDPREKLLNKTL